MMQNNFCFSELFHFPGETFRVLKDKELRQYGEYRTRRLVLEAWGTHVGEKNFSPLPFNEMPLQPGHSPIPSGSPLPPTDSP
jgi:hypothetical protein